MAKKPKHKTEVICNKSNKDFKNGSHKKNNNNKEAMGLENVIINEVSSLVKKTAQKQSYSQV